MDLFSIIQKNGIRVTCRDTEAVTGNGAQSGASVHVVPEFAQPSLLLSTTWTTMSGLTI